MTARRERMPTMGASNFSDTGGMSTTSRLPSARGTPRSSSLDLKTSTFQPRELHTEAPATLGSSRQPFQHTTDSFDRVGSALLSTRSKNTGTLASSRTWKQPQVQTLRTTFLEPETSIFPPSRTWSQLRKRISLIESPHLSYDLDEDGFVGQEDYRLSKHLDVDHNGVLHTTARGRGRRIIAEQFFQKHGDGISKFGIGNYKNQSIEQNIDDLANDKHFPLVLRQLRGKERSLMGRASGPMASCMQLEGEGLELTKHNFYTDKFDATAWNDFDAIPRASSEFGLTDHGGSRKRLMFSRKQIVREGNQDKLDYSDSLKPHYNTRKSNMITNIAIENS